MSELEISSQSFAYLKISSTGIASKLSVDLRLTIQRTLLICILFVFVITSSINVSYQDSNRLTDKMKLAEKTMTFLFVASSKIKALPNLTSHPSADQWY
jgi:hypothetical protein